VVKSGDKIGLYVGLLSQLRVVFGKSLQFDCVGESATLKFCKVLLRHEFVTEVLLV